MSAAILLDSGPLGVLANPRDSAARRSCRNWLSSLLAASRRVIVSEIADYEVRRELIRIRSRSAITNLNGIGVRLEYLPLTTPAMRQAAELWARARQSGRPTAPNHALDGDVILAAQALTLNTPVIIATGNPAHLSQYVPAELWSNITP